MKIPSKDLYDVVPFKAIEGLFTIQCNFRDILMYSKEKSTVFNVNFWISGSFFCKYNAVVQILSMDTQNCLFEVLSSYIFCLLL